MKILWITSDVLPQFVPEIKNGKPTLGGSWIVPLFNLLSFNQACDMGVVTPVVNGEYTKVISEKSIFYSLPIRKNENIKRIKKRTTEHYLNIISDFRPDIIHFHGTERNFGLLRSFVPDEIPLVGSIQGIINSYLPYLYMASSGYSISKYQSLKNRMGRGGIKGFKRNWRLYSEIERDIFSVNKYFIGRTLWDRAQAYGLNSGISYYHGEELLRDAFYDNNWDIKKCEKYSIFISSGAYPIKGLHTLVYAVSLLIKKFPDLKVYVPLFNEARNLTVRDYLIGEDYSNYIRSLISQLKLKNVFIPLKRLDATQMAERFRKSHVFVLSSFIENSSNALGEAMLTGTPTVVSFTGGAGSIVENEESSLFFPIGDYRTLAHQVERIFNDEQLAIKLSRNAQQIANIRHDKESVTSQYVDIYREIIKNHNEGIAHI